MPKVKEDHISKTERMKKSDYGFPEIMNATEACFYLWRRLDLNLLKHLEDTGQIFPGVLNGKKVYTKKDLDRYINDIPIRRVA